MDPDNRDPILGARLFLAGSIFAWALLIALIVKIVGRV
jgi:hypothetical protein